MQGGNCSKARAVFGIPIEYNKVACFVNIYVYVVDTPSTLVLCGALASLVLSLAVWYRLNHEQQLPDNYNEVCVVAPPSPYDADAGLPMFAPRPVPANARCPVCGMYPARAPEWAAQLIYSNGDAHFFDSPLSLFIFLQDAGRSGAWLNAKATVYVSGSSLLGPMRAGNLPAFSSAAAAQQFSAQYGGTLLQAQQISPQLLQSLSHHRHLATSTLRASHADRTYQIQ